MRMLSAVLLASVLTCLPSAATAAEEVPAESVEEVAQEFVDAIVAAWNAGDGAQYGSHFSEDADFRVWHGLFVEGREAIVAGHQRIFDTIYAGTNLRCTIQKVRPLTDTVVAVHNHCQVFRGEELTTQLPAMVGAAPLMVLVRGDEGWEIGLFQNTPILELRPPAADEAAGSD